MSNKKLSSVVSLLVAAAVIIMAVIVTCSGIDTYASFWALVPPIVAIGLALITKEVYSSLFLGIVVGGILGCGGNATTAVDHVVSTGIIAAIEGTAGIFLFLVILGIIVALINRAGGSAAFGRWAETHIKSRVGAQLATFVLGVLIFIDDYFNCLTVGSVMLPVTDSHKISRAKLSYLIDATAAPICMIAPVSSWAAAVSSYAEGTGLSGIELFIRAIPYNFYSLLTLVFVVAIVIMKADFGPMAKHERNAIEKGDLFSSEERVSDEDTFANPRGRVIDLILPVVVLVIISIVGLLYIGGFFGVDAWGGTECAGSLIAAFGNTDATVGLPWGSLIALIAIIAYLMVRKLVSFTEAMECMPKGFVAMVPAITILTLATALKNVSNDLLGSASYVEMLMQSEAAQSLQNFLPAVIFIVACLLAFATGTSWGTFGILIPIVSNMFDASNPLLFIGMSACLAGAVCGDHCSPISDTTIMSSAGARCVHVLHVSTQIPYAVSVAAISFICFVVAGFVPNAIITLALGVVLTIGFLFIMKKVTAKKA
ncbi:MAG: Na+/H+ antiporter NhaC family protein [Oscillospiraceae bacterium]|nr:Na+/H+ antiporter NhaC family protein [Oscillospiraceae bacterium]